QLAPHADDFIPGGNEFARETFESGFIKRVSFQERIARAQRLCITLKERQIFRAETDRSQRAQIIRELAHGAPVEAETAFGGRPIHFDFALALADDFAAGEITLLPMPDHLRAT